MNENTDQNSVAGILSLLREHSAWEDFLEYKRSGGHMSRREDEALASFIENREYLKPAESILSGRPFPHPEATVLNKKGSTKKRTVFTFPEPENTVLKFIGYQLGRYDGIFSGNLYSFRRNTGVKCAIRDLSGTPGISSMYSYKTDIHDYFNSVRPDLVIPMLYETFDDVDRPLADFLASLLNDPIAVREGTETAMRKGIMAGVPVSAFLADLCLVGLDAAFEEAGVPYARYSDDIIVFAETDELLCEREAFIKEKLRAAGLEINPDKDRKTVPGEPWEYLGFSVDGEKTDISQVAADKLKRKLKRKADALLRWKERNASKGADGERAVRAFFRYCSKKLFDNPIKNEITWGRWYFPVITADATLRELDAYILELARHIASGSWSGSRYRTDYAMLKKYGFKSLVNMFYKFKKTGGLDNNGNLQEENRKSICRT